MTVLITEQTVNNAFQSTIYKIKKIKKKIYLSISIYISISIYLIAYTRSFTFDTLTPNNPTFFIGDHAYNLLVLYKVEYQRKILVKW